MLNALRAYFHFASSNEDDSSDHGPPREHRLWAFSGTPEHTRSSSASNGIFGTLDHDVLARFRSGDISAFEQLFRSVYRPLTRYVQSIVLDSALSEDVVQELLFRVWQHRDTVALSGSFAAYLFGAARHAALNALRDRGRWYARDRQWSEEDVSTTPSSLAESVEALLPTLSPRCREVFMLRWREGLRYAEIATILGISVKTVEMQMTLAIKALRKGIDL